MPTPFSPSPSRPLHTLPLLLLALGHVAWRWTSAFKLCTYPYHRAQRPFLERTNALPRHRMTTVVPRTRARSWLLARACRRASARLWIANMTVLFLLASLSCATERFVTGFGAEGADNSAQKTSDGAEDVSNDGHAPSRRSISQHQTCLSFASSLFAHAIRAELGNPDTTAWRASHSHKPTLFPKRKCLSIPRFPPRPAFEFVARSSALKRSS